jgi:hypothetical protein
MKTETGLRAMGGAGKNTAQHALDAVETITHIAYALRAEHDQQIVSLTVNPTGPFHA